MKERGEQVEFQLTLFFSLSLPTPQPHFKPSSLSHHTRVQYFSFEPHAHALLKTYHMNSKLNDTINRLKRNDPTLTELNLECE
jgi:hypothetical protein